MYIKGVRVILLSITELLLIHMKNKIDVFFPVQH